MTRIETESLVLRAVDFGESDRVLHLLTPGSGRLTAVAKGAKRSRRRFSGCLDLFHLLHIEGIRSRPQAMLRLEQATLLHPFAGIARDSLSYAFGCHFLELLGRLTPEGMAPGDARVLFDFALEVLRSIDARRPDARICALLQIRTLQALGLRPELRACVRCGQEHLEGPLLAFHVGEGGVICARCLRPEDPHLPVHLGTLRSLEQGLALPPPQLHRLSLRPQALAETWEILKRFQHFHLGLTLRSEPFLDETLGLVGGVQLDT